MRGASTVAVMDVPVDVDLEDEEVRTRIIEKFIDRYGQRLFNLLYWKTGSYEDAKDLTSEVIFKIYKALPKFKGNSSLYTWAYRIALNHANRFLLKRKFQRLVSFEELKSDPMIVEQQEAYSECCFKEAVHEAIKKLPQKYRDVVILFYFDKLKYEEIAEIMGISVGTVKSRLNRARVKLSKLLEGVIT